MLGAGGQLGAAMTREFNADAGATLVALTHREADVTDPSLTESVLRLRPDVIINCAAWNDVDGAELDPAGAHRINVAGVQRLAEVATTCSATLVHYSSDFVFDGRKAGGYTEEDLAAPLNEYGRSKLAGEHEASRVPRHFILRLSSVFGGRPGEGAAGRVTIDRIVAAIVNGQDVRAFVDRTVTPSYTVDVARATRVMIGAATPSGIYHCVNGEATTWYELAGFVAKTLGVEGRIQPMHVAEVASGAPRPTFCALSNAKLGRSGVSMPDWRDALVRHLERRGLLRTVRC